MKINSILLLISVFLSTNTIFSQTIPPDSIEVNLTNNITAFGPLGFISYGIGPKSTINKDQLILYPETKNLPSELTEAVEYCFVFNVYQFYYQNYKSGLLTMEGFIEEVNNNKWNLSDTILLTPQILKNTVSIVVGRTTSNSYKFVIDENNNDDYADDTLCQLYSDIYIEQIISNVRHVDIEIFKENSIYKRKIPFYLRGDKPNDISVQVPEYSFGEFKILNKFYFVCAETYNPSREIFIMPRQPNFSSAQKTGIKPLQFVELGSDYYQFKSHSSDYSKILLVKKEVGRIIEKHEADSNNNRIVSAQIGLFAPAIAGKNIIDDKDIALTDYRGKYIFIDFWSTTCAPCINEFPHINNVIKTFDKSEFEVIGIVDIRSKMNIVDFLKSKSINWPTISMNSSTTKMKDYTIRSYPTSYLISPEGKIIDINLRGDELYQKLEELKIKKYVP
jgi:thiol-disulfide isomerase/thioredoxin